MAALTAYRNDPAVAALQDWELPYSREGPHSPSGGQAHRLRARRGHQVAIELDGELVGDVYRTARARRDADIGYSLIPSAQGRGVVSKPSTPSSPTSSSASAMHRIVAELPGTMARLFGCWSGWDDFRALRASPFWWRAGWDDNLWPYGMSAEQWRPGATARARRRRQCGWSRSPGQPLDVCPRAPTTARRSASAPPSTIRIPMPSFTVTGTGCVGPVLPGHRGGR